MIGVEIYIQAAEFKYQVIMIPVFQLDIINYCDFIYTMFIFTWTISFINTLKQTRVQNKYLLP